MPSDRGGGLLSRAMSLATTLLLIAVLLYVAVRLIESVWPVLLAIVGGLAALGLLIWGLRRRQRNRYW